MTTAADAWVVSLSEADYQEMIVARAKARGWKVHHDRGDYRTCIAGDPGFPDLVLAKAGRVLFIEVKSERGKVSHQQQQWIDQLPRTAFVARPSDWPTIQILIDTTHPDAQDAILQEVTD